MKAFKLIITILVAFSLGNIFQINIRETVAGDQDCVIIYETPTETSR